MPPQADQTDTASPLPRRAPPRRSAAIVAAMTITLMTLVACSGMDGGGMELLHRGDGLDHPTAVAVRPDGSGDLWVTNQGDDSLTVLRREDGRIVAETRRDAYGEHFSANPSGIAFTDGGDRFSLSNDSTNENNNIDFQLNPERNLYFKNNSFMGPTLFSADSFARVLLLDWSDFRVRRVYYTGLDGLSGLTIDRRGDLVMTDTATDAVYRMPLG